MIIKTSGIKHEYMFNILPAREEIEVWSSVIGSNRHEIIGNIRLMDLVLNGKIDIKLNDHLNNFKKD